MNVRTLVNNARRRLEHSGIASADAALDARVLARHVLGWDAAKFVISSAEPAPAEFAERYGALVTRRERREPLAYIVGHREFWGLEFEVSPATLIPRPETELIVECLLELRPDRSPPFRAADVGTGSGCLAVSIAREYPAVEFVATDISPAALSVARRNAARHGVGDRLTFVETDLLEGVSPEPFDIIVSNPPYVPEVHRDGLQPEVRDYEPASALFAGNDGLAVVRHLGDAAVSRLAPGGLLLFEFGFGQADRVAELISTSSGLTMVSLRNDLQGIPRVAIVRR